MNVGDRVRVNDTYNEFDYPIEPVGTIEYVPVHPQIFYRVRMDNGNEMRFVRSELDPISSATAAERETQATSPTRARKDTPTMENIFITIDGVTHEFAEVTNTARTAPAPLNVQRKFVVYAADGTRVDGYKYESRARRNNDARFAGTGYWLGKVNEGDFTWIPA